MLRKKLISWKAEFDYSKAKYIPLFKYTKAPGLALVVWLIVMQIFYSLAIDGSPAYATGAALPQILRAGSNVVGIVMVVTTIGYALWWDKLNALLYALEAFATWGAYKMATYVPIAVNSIGRLFCITLIGVMLSIFFTFFINELVIHDRNERQEDGYYEA